MQEFLKERRGILLPKFWDYIIFIYVVGSLGCICAEFLGMRSVAVYGSFYLPVFLGMPATLATTMIAWRKGYSPAAYLFISRAVLECGLALNYITAINLLPVGLWFTGKIIYYAPALEMILFAFALGERISVLQNDKREAERKALEGEVYRLKNEELAQANAEILRQQEVLVEQARDIELANSMLNEKNLRLGETLDQLKVAQSRLVQSEKMASLGIVTAGMAHEINNPITFIAASIPILRRTFDHVIEIIQYYEPLANARTIEVVQDTLREIERLKKTLEFEFLVEDIHQCLSSIQHGVERITDVVRGLRVFSRLDEDVLKFVNLHEGLDATLAILRHQYEGRIGISKHYGANVPDIECFSSQIHQVFMNILANAIQAIPDSGSITITTKLHDKHVQISITDTGVGMNQEIQRHIFDPFYTTKPIGQGTGLGLAIVYGIIEKHSGKIAVQSVPQQGTTMTVDLPVRQR